MQKNSVCPANELFLLHTVEAIGKLKKYNNSFWKNVQVVELLYHKCRNNREIHKCKLKYTNPANEFVLNTVEAIGKKRIFFT